MTKQGVPFVLIAAFAACSSGQTGSPDCAAVTTCACDSLFGRDVVRARVVAVEASGMEIEVEEMYSYSPSPVTGPGERVTLPYSLGPSACDDTGGVPSPAAGDLVLAALDHGVGNMWLVPWTDPLDLGDRQVPIDELPERADPSTCDADVVQPPCNDVVTNTSCSVVAPRRAPANHGAIAALLAALFARGCARVLGRRRSRAGGGTPGMW